MEKIPSQTNTPLPLLSNISYELQYKKPLLYLGNNKKFNSIKSVKIKNNKVLGEK